MKQFKEPANWRTLSRFILKKQNTGQLIPESYFINSANVAATLGEIHRHEGNDLQEFFYIVFLNRANRTTGYITISMGGITGTVADPRCILAAAVLSGCVSLIMCHNHPSGSVKPSRSDEELTTKIREAAKYFDIRVIDHVIISEKGDYYSFADEGII